MVNQTLVFELQQILASDFEIYADLKETSKIGDSLTKYFELLINMNNNEKLKVPIKK